VKDTAFLTFDYPDAGREDDQWLYLPALRKVRRISAANRGDAFLGTDFSYEDIKLEGKVSLSDYRYRTVGEEEVDGHRVWLVEGTPVDERTARELGYGRVLLRVDPEIWMVRLVEYWNPRGDLLKTTRVEKIERIDGYWTTVLVEVENHRSGHRSVFEFEESDYEGPIDDDLFTERGLKRGLR
jgi:hypothetical protein